MAKAILSNRIYLDTTPDILEQLKKTLTYKIKKPPRPGLTHFTQFDIIKNYKLLPKGVIAIPIGRIDLIPKDYEIVDKRIYEEYPFPDPKLQLRGNQVSIYEDIDDNAFINAMVGFGKTFLALHIAKKLGQKTLVVCHNTMLRDQWIEEVKKLYNMECGIIGSGKFDIDHVITIGNIQTLTKELPKISKEFGTVIVDECLDYNSQIITLEKGKVMLGNIVNNEMPVHVLSLDPSTGVSSYKKVVRYFKTPHTDCLKISHSGGGSFKCTANHNIYTYGNGVIEKVTADTLEVGDLLLQTTTTHTLNEEEDPIALEYPQLQYKLNSLRESIKDFNFPLPDSPFLNKHYCLRRITNIKKSTLTGNHKYNIEVEDNHTYFANSILVANCHHVTATTFSTFLDGMYARYKIGLSGTMNRKDGKHILFKDFFGLKLYQPPQENTMVPKVRIVKTGVGLSEGDAWAIKINKLLYDPDYQELIAVIAAQEIVAGHKVLIIADRVEFLQKVGELIGPECVCIVGETTFEQRVELKRQIEDGEKSCIAGSRQIFSEGISVNILSCVILAAPIANDALLEQIIGRIMRMQEGKLEPLVIDMNFASPSDRRQNKMRLALYQRKGWEIE